MKVYDYDVDGSRHCREGLATEERGVLLDTFWGSGYGDRHRLSDVERASIRFRFDTDDFEEVHARGGAPKEWWDRAPKDRSVISSQHGLQARYFIRKGSQPDPETRIENAQRAVDEAESALRSAEATLRRAREALDEAQDGAR